MSILWIKFKNLIKIILPTRTEKFIKRLKKPPHKINKDGKILLHLGCGLKDDNRFVNIDLKPFPHVHYVKNIEDLSFLRDNFADLIYACHVLEHISYKKLDFVLRGWYRVLKKGGILRLSVPNFDMLISVYINEDFDISKIISSLLGEQDDQYNFHKSIFTYEYLYSLLYKAGFKKIYPWSPNNANYTISGDWSTKLLLNKYNINLNIEAQK